MINALQAAIYQRLSSQLAVSVYDEVPQSIDPSDASGYPYVVIHGAKLNNNDTDTELGFDGYIEIHTWSLSRGFKEVYGLMEQIYNALHYFDLIVTGYGVSTIHQEYSEAMRDPDGISRHGVQRFRVIFEPTS